MKRSDFLARLLGALGALLVGRPAPSSKPEGLKAADLEDVAAKVGPAYDGGFLVPEKYAEAIRRRVFVTDELLEDGEAFREVIGAAFEIPAEILDPTSETKAG